MKTEEIMQSSNRMSAKIAKQFVDEVVRNFVPEDVDKRLEQMIQRFADTIRRDAAQELKFRRMRQVQSSTQNQ